MSTKHLLSRKIANSSAGHQQRIRKIASHVLAVTDHRIKTAGAAADILGGIKGHIADNPGAYIGGAAGAAGGAAIGAATGGRGKRVGRAILGAILGGGAGAGVGYGVDQYMAGPGEWQATDAEKAMVAEKERQDAASAAGVDRFNEESARQAVERNGVTIPESLIGAGGPAAIGAGRADVAISKGLGKG